MSRTHGLAPASAGDWVQHVSGRVKRVRRVKPDGYFITDEGPSAFGATWAWDDCVKVDAPAQDQATPSEPRPPVAVVETHHQDCFVRCTCGGVTFWENAWTGTPAHTYSCDWNSLCICDRLNSCEQRAILEGREIERAAAVRAVQSMENHLGYPDSHFDHIKDDAVDAIRATGGSR